jgi:hypothetical protein
LVSLERFQMLLFLFLLLFLFVPQRWEYMTNSLDYTYTKPSTCASNFIQSYRPSSMHNTSCDRNLSFFSFFFLICSLNYMHLYTHSRADWHSGISERERERERISLTLVRWFFFLFLLPTHTSVPVYICPRIEHFILVMANV